MSGRLAALLFLLPALALAQADPTSRPAGHILLDGGFVETVPLIRESMRKLGFWTMKVDGLNASERFRTAQKPVGPPKILMGDAESFWATQKDSWATQRVYGRHKKFSGGMERFCAAHQDHGRRRNFLCRLKS